MTVNSPKAIAIHRGGKGAVGGKALAEDQRNKDQKMTLVKRPVGLVNLGNTCFMNAALQCLSRTPGLMEKLELLATNPVVTFSGDGLKYGEDADGKVNKVLKLQLEVPSDALARKMVHLLKQMTEGTHTVNPRAVHCVMAKVFGAGLQHDSHELLRHVLDKLKKDQIRAFRIALMDMFGIPRQEASKMHQSNPKKALEVKEWDRKLYHVTVIDDLFGGELVTTRTCLECKSLKTSREEFLDLSLPIRVVRSGGENKPASLSMNNRFSLMNEATTINRTLFECLRCFTEPETLSGNNCVDCEKCHELKLAEVKAGKPIEEVFPQPPPAVEVESKSYKAGGTTKKFVKTRKAEGSQKEKSDEKPHKDRRRKKRKTRAEKIAEDQERAAGGTEDNSNDGDVDTERQVVSEANPEVASGKSSKSNSDAESADQDKAADEGYAEDFKETDDSSGVSARSSGDNDADKDDPVVNDDKGDDGDDSASEDENEEEAPEEVVQPQEPVIPKSTKSACSRQTMIHRPPRILTVHLKRFTVGSRGYTCKLSDHVQFEEYIDIRDYVNTNLPYDDDDENSNEGGPISPGSWSFEDLNTKEQDVLGGASRDDGSAFVLGPLRLRGDAEPGPSRLITAELKSPSAEPDDAKTEKGPEGDCCDSTKETVPQPEDFNGTKMSSAPEELVQYGPEEMKGSDVLFEFDTNEGNAGTSELQPIFDVSPISRTGPIQREAELTLKDCEADAEGPAPVDDLCGGIEDMDDEPPPYPGSPTFDDDEILPAREDPSLPAEGDTDSVNRWVASRSLDGDYDKVTDDPPADPFEDLNAKQFGSSLFLDEAETLRAPLDSCSTTYNEDTRHRLPSYNEVIQSVDSPAANIWGSTVTTPMVNIEAKSGENETSPTMFGPEDQEQSTETILGFEDNFEPAPAPPPLPPIALGYEPLHDHNVPVVVQDFEAAAATNGDNVSESGNTDGASEGQDVDVVSPETEESKVHPDPNGINYRLYGIVEHGGSLNWGHYVAYIRVGSDWYYISDSSVSNSSISTVLSRDPYILFYERI